MADANVKIRGGDGNAVQIQSRDIDAVAPTDGQALAWSNSDSEWEPTTISAGSSEWTDTGTVLHPSEETVDNVVVGGTTTGNSDIVLGVDGSAVFNEQGAAVDFRVESDDEGHMLLVDGGSNRLGVIIKTPPNTLSVSPTQYSTGTASQSAKAVTGVGTTWTTDMIGGDFIYADGTSSGRITACASTTSIAVTTSQTVGSQSYRIHYGGLHVTSAGKFGLGTSTPTEFCEVEGPTPFLSIRNTSETEAGIILSDSLAPIAQFARILLDSGGGESGLTAGFSIMTAGGDLTGQINAPASGTTITGSGTAFLTELLVGDRLILKEDGQPDSTAEIRTITAIASNTELTVASAFSDLGNDSNPAFEVRAMQIKKTGAIGMGINPTTGAEKLVLNGAMALKEQSSAPSATVNYGKIYAKEYGNDTDTILLLTGDGANDGQTFTDSSAGGSTHVFAAEGDQTGWPKTVTGTKKYGTASMAFNGVDEQCVHLATPHSDFDLGTGDFTMDGWFNWSSIDDSYYMFQIGKYDTGFTLLHSDSDYFVVYMASGVKLLNTPTSPAWQPVLGQWYHIACQRRKVSNTSAKFSLFVDGIELVSVTNAAALASVSNATYGVSIGGDTDSSPPGGAAFNGFIDELRLSKTARYRGNFIPPGSAYPLTGLYALDSAGNSHELTPG